MMDPSERYEVIEEIGQGTYGVVYLSEDRLTGNRVAMKCLAKSTTKYKEFANEHSVSTQLSLHRNVIATLPTVFETDNQFVLLQEYASFGDLFDAITPHRGMKEHFAKRCIEQIASALEYMHDRRLVHRDIKPENVLLFDGDCSLVKLTDFGMVKRVGTMVKKMKGHGTPYTPPEICEALCNERFYVETSLDCWSFGVLMFCILTGNFPWELGTVEDRFFYEFTQWQRGKTVLVPSQWRKLTPRLLRLFRKLLAIKPEKRCSVREVSKYINNNWFKHESVDVSEKTQHGGYEINSILNNNAMEWSGDNEDLNQLLREHGINTRSDKSSRQEMTACWVEETLTRRQYTINTVCTPPEHRHKVRMAFNDVAIGTRRGDLADDFVPADLDQANCHKRVRRFPKNLFKILKKNTFS